MTAITLLTLSGATWSSFGILATTVNSLISRANALGEASDVFITGGNINGVDIGSTVPGDGEFNNLTINTQLTITGANLTLDNNSISGDAISGGTIEADYIELSNAPTADDHATTKLYVDDLIESTQQQLIAYSVIFGG